MRFLGFFFLLSFAILLPGLVAHAQEAAPNEIIKNLYNFGLMVGGILAFGAIVWGGVEYALAAGNPGKQGDAKDRVIQALIGLVLLAGSYVVLAAINPDIVENGILELTPLDTVSSAGACPEMCDPGEVCAGNGQCKKCSLQCEVGTCVFGPGGTETCWGEQLGACGEDDKFGICSDPQTQACLAPQGRWDCYECNESPERCPWLGVSSASN